MAPYRHIVVGVIAFSVCCVIFIQLVPLSVEVNVQPEVVTEYEEERLPWLQGQNQSPWKHEERQAVGERKTKHGRKKDRKEDHEEDNTPLKTIILWTTMYGSDTWWGFEKLGRQPLFRHKCPVNACNLTRDRSLVHQADMLVFFHNDDPEWPEVRYPHQLYVHTTNEPPGPDQLYMKSYDGRINLTMNYRLDADIPFPYQHYVPLPPERKIEGVYWPKTPVTQRNRSIVWPVSHCNASSKRDDYAKELSKYIDVDVYGECGNLTCARLIWNTCYFKWEKQYKFYLAFENNYCLDYVTEKLFGTLSFEIVPIVFGWADYKKIAPPHSVIDVRDYKTPKELADYLYYLSDHPDEYMKYFQWKRESEIEDGYVYKTVCKLCAAAHNISFTNKPALANYSDWYLNSCNNNIVDEWRANW